MRQRDSDLGEDVHDEARAVEARRARAAVDVGRPQVLHRDPDDPAVARGAGAGAAGIAVGDLGRPGSFRRRCELGDQRLRRSEPCACLALELSLAPLLARPDLSDLGSGSTREGSGGRAAPSIEALARLARRRAAPAERAPSENSLCCTSARNFLTSPSTLCPARRRGRPLRGPRSGLPGCESRQGRQVWSRLAGGVDRHDPGGERFCARLRLPLGDRHSTRFSEIGTDRGRASRSRGCTPRSHARATHRGSGSAPARSGPAPVWTQRSRAHPSPSSPRRAPTQERPTE